MRHRWSSKTAGWVKSENLTVENMKSEEGFNLSEWALNHRSLMIFIMVLVFVAGAYSYTRLGREEDPGFIIRTMVVTTQWPGASAKEGGTTGY